MLLTMQDNIVKVTAPGKLIYVDDGGFTPPSR
jgi:hypothetical protein